MKRNYSLFVSIVMLCAVLAMTGCARQKELERITRSQAETILSLNEEIARLNDEIATLSKSKEYLQKTQLLLQQRLHDR